MRYNLCCLQAKSKQFQPLNNYFQLNSQYLHSLMRPGPFDVPYGRSSKYARQQQEDDDEYFKNYLRDIEDQYIGNRTRKSKEFYKRSRPSKKKHRQKLNQQQRSFPWQQRYKGKSKLNQVNQKLSQKQKIKLQQKNINYDALFRELSYGNSTDVVAAAITYKEILQSLVLYIMEKQLEMDVIYAYKKSNLGKKGQEWKQQSSSMKLQGTLRNADQIVLECNSGGDQEDSLQMPFKEQSQVKQAKKQSQTKIDEQRKCVVEFEQDKKFIQQSQKFKRVSSPSSIISVIPYKSIPSLLIIQSLNFIIEKTSEQYINKYFQQHDKLLPVYQEMNAIARSSKEYLVEEKLKKGLRYFAQVEKKLNTIYQKKTSKPKSSETKSNQKLPDLSRKEGSSSQFEERKTSTTKEESNATVEERKEDYPRENQKDK